MALETLCKVPEVSPSFITISSLDGLATVLNQTRYFFYILLLMYYFLRLSFALVLELFLTNQVHQLPFAVLR